MAVHELLMERFNSLSELNKRIWCLGEAVLCKMFCQHQSLIYIIMKIFRCIQVLQLESLRAETDTMKH